MASSKDYFIIYTAYCQAYKIGKPSAYCLKFSFTLADFLTLSHVMTVTLNNQAALYR